MQKTVLLFGAGKSATALIHYLIAESAVNNWLVIIADTDKKLILTKTNNSPFVDSVEINIKNDGQRTALVQSADIVISLMPPSLHILIAKDCIRYGKNLLTASYIDEQIKALEPEIKNKGLLFLCEMGLDPGIDHMSAMELIDSIHAKGGKITSFKSHCGGLIAPESDDNPWHYKISWNPKNIVMAGKAGASYKMENKIVEEKYETLFDVQRGLVVPELGFYSYYPNRDSIHYINLYGLQEADTFLRTTLRPVDFMIGWKHIVKLKLTDETQLYQTDGLSLAAFFQLHFKQNGLEDWQQTMNADEASLVTKQLLYLGMDDAETFINKANCSTIDVLQFALEATLVLQPQDKDMIIMLHEISYVENNETKHLQSILIVKGDDAVNTAMAKTVGLPLGIAATLILNNTIKLSGLHVPVKKEIYEPVLKELKKYGICFDEAFIHNFT